MLTIAPQPDKLITPRAIAVLAGRGILVAGQATGSGALDAVPRPWLELRSLTGERAERFRRRRQDYERQVEAVLRAGVGSGEFRDIDPRLTAMAWLGMHNYTYLWLKPGGRLSARDVAKPFADIFIRGIANPQGAE